MFVGHAAVAFVARPRLGRRSLGTLLAGAFLVDLIWPILLLLGVEAVRISPGDTAFTPLAFVYYPWTHSLVMAVVWGVVFAAVVERGRLRLDRESLWLIGLVVSHWLLDAVTHRPDLPVVPGGSTLVGLGLWRSVSATLLLEGTLFAIGLTTYLRATVARDRIGSAALWGLAALLGAIWLSGPFSPPPASPTTIGIMGPFMWLIPAWGWWADRHRGLRGPRARAT